MKNEVKKIRVAVLAGGKSSEREVSLLSGERVLDGIIKLGHDAKIYDPAKDMKLLIDLASEIDLVFPVLHGKYGEDGTLQGFLELIGLPYVGSGVYASALAMDKEKTREVYEKSGLKIPKGIVVNKTLDDLSEVKKDIGMPCVVKPVADGSSFGITIVKNEGELNEAIVEALKFDGGVLIEEYIGGIEITVGVIGNDNPVALPVIMIKPKGEFFDFDAKYSGECEEIVLALIDEKVAKRAQEFGKVAHRILGCRGLSRTDMIIRKGEIYLLETNTMPGMTGESLLPKAANAGGLEFEDLMQRLIELALEGSDGKENSK